MSTFTTALILFLGFIMLLIVASSVTSVIVNAYYTRKEKHYAKMLIVLGESLKKIAEEAEKRGV